MIAKRPAKKGPEHSGPVPSLEEIKLWLEPYPDSVREACLRLAADPEIGQMWGTRFDTADFRQFVFALDQATGRDAWGRMPQGQRDEWWNDFQRTSDHLLHLMDSAPTPANQWGMPVRDVVLLELLRVCGMNIPKRDTTDYYAAMLRYEAIADDMGFNIANALRWYVAQQKADIGPKQILRKPRDQKSDRAHFIVALCRYTNCTDSTIAAVAAVVFLDAAIDARLVRRLRPA